MVRIIQTTPKSKMMQSFKDLIDSQKIDLINKMEIIMLFLLV